MIKKIGTFDPINLFNFEGFYYTKDFHYQETKEDQKLFIGSIENIFYDLGIHCYNHLQGELMIKLSFEIDEYIIEQWIADSNKNISGDLHLITDDDLELIITRKDSKNFLGTKRCVQFIYKNREMD